MSGRDDGPDDVSLLAAALTGSLRVLAGALLVAGMATAPTMITNMTLVQGRTPEGRLNEGMTLAVTGLLGGIACGSAAGGWTAEHVSATAGYGVPVAAPRARWCCHWPRPAGPIPVYPIDSVARGTYLRPSKRFDDTRRISSTPPA